ncbi:MAG: alanine dehydrogenase [Candidatus Gastranaerophilales bacterium]|nr:alanine dehydrogenase [Candidatus Gastranaerophilales bacterium]
MKYNFGVVKELKEGETRVAITPDVVAMLQADGLNVLIESGAGNMSGFSDEDYISNGATVVASAEEVWNNSKVIVKVKEPQPSEFKYFRPDLIIFSYLHLSIEEELTKELLKKKVTTIASESVKTTDNQLPLLTPMSEIAGRLAVQIGARLLESHKGGSGVLLSGVPGVQPGKVIIIGAGVAGFNAAQIAIGMGADVSIFDVNPKKLVQIDGIYGTSIKTHYCNPAKIAQEVPKADILITCVLNPSHAGETIVSEEVVKTMKKGSVIVDVAIDQGGNVETIDRCTTHENPTYEKHGVLHCAIPNIPSAVPKTASYAYSYAMYPYLKSLGEKGIIEAIKENQDLSNGVATFNGDITNAAVAEALGQEYTQIELLVGFKLK